MSEFYTGTDHFSILPAIMLALFGCAILLFDFWVFPDPRHRKWLLIFVAFAEGFTGVGLYQQASRLHAQGVRGTRGARSARVRAPAGQPPTPLQHERRRRHR